MIEPKPYLLYNKIQNYVWGTKGKDAFIPKLLGINAEENVPYAELWIGSHPKAPSEVLIDNKRIPLNELIKNFPVEILGKKNAERFNNSLPFLLKVLSADEPLSIQAHPSKQEAKILHARDPINYPDENHKPEIAIVLDELTALVGFKKISDVKNIIKNYTGFKKYINHEVYTKILESQPHSDLDEKEKLKAFYSSIIKDAEKNRDNFTLLINSIKKEIEHIDRPDKKEFENLFLKMFEKYGYDIGLISILFFNLIKLSKGEALYTPAGMPHAYISGNIVECMANSDNVIRAGLTSKFKDINTLLELIDYTPGEPELVKVEPNNNLKHYITPADEFDVKLFNMKAGSVYEQLSNKPIVFLIMEGSLEVTFEKGSYRYKKGDSFLIPAILDKFSIICQENCEIFSAEINL